MKAPQIEGKIGFLQLVKIFLRKQVLKEKKNNNKQNLSTTRLRACECG
jgi:hypothetical protein